jgi:hypothetical protein
MADMRFNETMEIQCAEEDRKAALLVTWEQVDGERRLVGVECDHPHFRDLDNWQCHWSCWERVRKQAGVAAK